MAIGGCWSVPVETLIGRLDLAQQSGLEQAILQHLVGDRGQSLMSHGSEPAVELAAERFHLVLGQAVQALDNPAEFWLESRVMLHPSFLGGIRLYSGYLKLY